MILTISALVVKIREKTLQITKKQILLEKPNARNRSQAMNLSTRSTTGWSSKIWNQKRKSRICGLRKLSKTRAFWKYCLQLLLTGNVQLNSSTEWQMMFSVLQTFLARWRLINSKENRRESERSMKWQSARSNRKSTRNQAGSVQGGIP